MPVLKYPFYSSFSLLSSIYFHSNVTVVAKTEQIKIGLKKVGGSDQPRLCSSLIFV